MTSILRQHLRYLSYIARHKWFVFQECCKLGIPWRGVVHDLSKFRPDEWEPYRRHFYGGPWPQSATLSAGEKYERNPRTRERVDEEFDAAWLRHIHRNPHHPQYWILHEDVGGVRCLPIPEKVWLEMVADWRGAGRAQGKGDNTVGWYKEHRSRMKLHPATREHVETLLGITRPLQMPSYPPEHVYKQMVNGEWHLHGGHLHGGEGE